MKILLVGEARGAHEEAHGHAFVGPSGREELARIGSGVGLLPPLPNPHPSQRTMIRYWSMCRERNIGVTNVFNAHPPNNRIEYFFVGKAERASIDLPMLRNGKYISPKHMHHIIRLWDEIATAKPNIVVALGNSALWATSKSLGSVMLVGQSTKVQTYW